MRSTSHSDSRAGSRAGSLADALPSRGQQPGSSAPSTANSSLAGNSTSRKPASRSKAKRKSSGRQYHKGASNMDPKASGGHDDDESVNTASSHEDDKTVESRASGAEQSRRSTNSAMAAMKFKERSDKKAKADYSYKYKGTQSTDDRTTMWLANFEGRIEEFVFPSLQLADSGAQGSSNQVDRQRRVYDDGGQQGSSSASRIRFPKWTRLVKDHDRADEREGDRGISANSRRKADFAKELTRGEKFLRDKIQHSNGKGFSKREADPVDKGPVSAMKSQSIELSRAIGIRGDSAALLDPAHEVYKSLLSLSVSRVAKPDEQEARANAAEDVSFKGMYESVSKPLLAAVDDSNELLLNGLIYYQLQNKMKEIQNKQKLEKSQNEALSDDGRGGEAGLSTGHNERWEEAVQARVRGTLQQRRSAELKEDSLNMSSVDSLDRADKIMREEAMYQEIAAQTTINLNRVHRASESRRIGFEFDEILHILPHINEHSKEIVVDNLPMSPIAASRSFYSGGSMSSTYGDLAQKSELYTATVHIPANSREKSGTNLSLPIMSGLPIEKTLEDQKMHAKDLLLLAQLRNGRIPEQLLKRVPQSVSLVQLNLAHFGMGDELGLCLGACLSSLSTLDALGLCDNRLTFRSLPSIFENINLRNLKHIDVSDNDMRGKGAESLARMFQRSNILSILELSQCKLKLGDFSKICNALCEEKNELKELCVSRNGLISSAANYVAAVLTKPDCSLKWLDISWNSLDSSSGGKIAEALKTNNSLTYLDLSSNALRGSGAQEIAACLEYNKALQVLMLNMNNIDGKACFVFSKTLNGHPNMKKLDLSHNPLGEPGARSIFRVVLRGLNCFVAIRNCTFSEDPTAFNHSNPGVASPYLLDMSEPYQCAVLQELMNLYRSDSANCKIESVTHRPTAGAKETSIGITLKDGQIVTRGNNTKWEPPTTGILKVHFSFKVSMPTLADAVSPEAFKMMTAMVIHARSDADRKNWLWLLSLDLKFTTVQAQDLMDTLIRANLIEPGGITKVDVVRSVWDNIIDTENKYAFFCHNLDEEKKISLGHAISLEKLKFNWINPTGHWRLDLANRVQRDVIMMLVALNKVESTHSKTKARRGDTSQKGNWNNFRNERYNHSQEVCFDDDYASSLPYTGILEFDYVSTTRPEKIDVPTITSSELEAFFAMVGLNPRRRLHISKSIFKIVELQLAVAKYYFLTSNLPSIMDCFHNDDSTQAQVVVCLFSRVRDLENFTNVFRGMKPGAIRKVIETIGVLNLCNPLRPSLEYHLSMKYADNRIFIHSMCTLASNESGDQIKENPKTEVLMIDLFASMGRIVQDERDKMVRFSYCEIGERSCVPAWNLRRDFVSKFLLGTQPMDPASVFKDHTIYKELEAAGTLGFGPLDLQYREYLKAMSSPDKRRKQQGLAASLNATA